MKEAIFIKKGGARYKTREDGKLYRMLMKSSAMEAIVSELEVKAISKWYKHKGEEIHIILQGTIEYSVGTKTYLMNEGDALWHPSSINHRATNIGSGKAIYITVGSPPTFI
jgi:quercetin dioxygenase-like cupin family protein